ncbi:hypothetical protein [Blastochloris tepida]|uniref:Uncharacterized protein n=1 Tax=Blastochloris tepida TaxID=2233851 RepID=A0A348G1C2_9HYPH|nr:hypothetical protein [Blastochloris tepida]BBF93355.1 hypothetical protein BLTE_20400 [Blastochloris tepida]
MFEVKAERGAVALLRVRLDPAGGRADRDMVARLTLEEGEILRGALTAALAEATRQHVEGLREMEHRLAAEISDKTSRLADLRRQLANASAQAAEPTPPPPDTGDWR